MREIDIRLLLAAGARRVTSGDWARRGACAALRLGCANPHTTGQRTLDRTIGTARRHGQGVRGTETEQHPWGGGRI